MATATEASAAAESALTRAQGIATARIRANLLTALQRLWRSLTAYREGDAAAFSARVVPLVAAAQYQVATLTGAYLTRRYSQLTGSPIQPVTLAPDGFTDTALRGVEPRTVYERPFHQIWTDLSEGKPFTPAVQAAEKRLTDIAATDVQLAKTHAARQVMETQDEIVGYRRVLKGSYSCGLCIVAATQRYHKHNLMPIHPGCDCEVDELVAGQDLPQVIEPGMLDEIHKRIAAVAGQADLSAREPDYRKYIVTHEHGELGPVIAVRGQHFEGPRDFPSS